MKGWLQVPHRAHPDASPEDKDRIEDDVAESADGNGNHAGFGITLCVDKGIESERHLTKKVPQT